jgi:hypothetical protein
MPKSWTNIKESDLPTRPKATTKTMQMSLDVVSSLKAGVAAQVELEEGESARGIKGSLRKAAKALGVEVELADHNNMVFVRLADK